jgi:hypothetical protein
MRPIRAKFQGCLCPQKFYGLRTGVAPYVFMESSWDEERSVGMISYADLPYGVGFFCWRWELLWKKVGW